MKTTLRSKSRPTAVFCVNDILAVGARHACRDRGIDVPGELSIMGFDDHPVAEQVTPPLSTIRVPTDAMGREATRSLLRAVKTGAPVSRVCATVTVVHESKVATNQPATLRKTSRHDLKGAFHWLVALQQDQIRPFERTAHVSTQASRQPPTNTSDRNPVPANRRFAIADLDRIVFNVDGRDRFALQPIPFGTSISFSATRENFVRFDF
ncbi:MAG: LacI family transcriptional regulator [Proteobacteria bacterium]|nr:MAG: LacI family transcriptional regulator [Pseudomonadota bacterium]